MYWLAGLTLPVTSGGKLAVTVTVKVEGALVPLLFDAEQDTCAVPEKVVLQFTVAWLIDALIVPAVFGDKLQCKVMPDTIGGTEYWELAVGIITLAGPETGPGGLGAPATTNCLPWAFVSLTVNRLISTLHSSSMIKFVFIVLTFGLVMYLSYWCLYQFTWYNAYQNGHSLLLQYRRHFLWQ